jgi:hypothetical protein
VSGKKPAIPDCFARQRSRPFDYSAAVLARSVAVLLAVAFIAAAPTATAQSADTREVEARKAYAAGRYKDAVEIYSNLYATTLHPTYLRNIGRCYQNLEEPQLAIKSYQEYLRKGSVPPVERREIDGFIAEMEALKRQQAASTPGPAPPAPAPPAPAMPAAAAPAPYSAVEDTPVPSAAQSSSSSATLAARAPEPEPASTPFYTRWWFWTVLGLVVAGGAAAFFLTRSDGGPSTDYGPYTPTWK